MVAMKSLVVIVAVLAVGCGAIRDVEPPPVAIPRVLPDISFVGTWCFPDDEWPRFGDVPATQCTFEERGARCCRFEFPECVSTWCVAACVRFDELPLQDVPPCSGVPG
jgi:hypothetical protein